MDARARVVIVGGGIGGCSLAYHLAQLGETDVVLLEKGELTSGSTWHAAGLCTQFNASRILTQLLMYSVELYTGLEAETGRPVDFRQVGSVRLATTSDRMDEFRHAEGKARVVGLPFELIGVERIRQLAPLLNLDDVLVRCVHPHDGYVDPSSVTNALARGARDAGVRIERRSRGDRDAREAGRRLGRRDRERHDRGRHRRERRRDVGAGDRADGRRRAADRPARPQFLTTDAVPALGELRPRDPRHPRSRPVVLRARRGRRPARRAVRAEPHHMDGARAAERLRVEAPRTRSPPDRGRDRVGRRSRAGVRRCRDQGRDQRPGRLHARREVPDGVGTRRPRPVRAGGVQHLRHRVRRRRGQVRGGMDRRRPAVEGHVRGGRAALRPVGRRASLPVSEGARRLRARVRHPLPPSGAASRSAAADRSPLRAARGPRGGVRAEAGMGTRAMVRAGGRDPRGRTDLPPPELVRPRRRRVPGRPRARRGPGPDVVREASKSPVRAPRRSSMG